MDTPTLRRLSRAVLTLLLFGCLLACVLLDMVLASRAPLDWLPDTLEAMEPLKENQIAYAANFAAGVAVLFFLVLTYAADAVNDNVLLICDTLVRLWTKSPLPDASKFPGEKSVLKSVLIALAYYFLSIVTILAVTTAASLLSTP